VWICADGELARRAHGALQHPCDADLACVMLIDAPSGPIGLVERTSEAREEFLDCMAVLISAQRLQNEPEIACCRRADGPPPPEARLRPLGKSLRSEHISGPICVWLAQAAEDLMPNSQAPFISSRRDESVTAIPIESRAPTSQPQAHLASATMPVPGIVDLDGPTTDGQRRVAPSSKAPARAKKSALRDPGYDSNGRRTTPVRRGSSSPPEVSATSHSDTGADAHGRRSASAGMQGDKAVDKVSSVSAPSAPQGSTAGGRLPSALAGATDARMGGKGSADGNENALPRGRDTTAREAPSSDGMPMMMGGWVADGPPSGDPAALSKLASRA
jgi:hypothetical protein